MRPTRSDPKAPDDPIAPARRGSTIRGRSFGAALAVALLLLPAGLSAQTEERAGDPTPRTTLTVCDGDKQRGNRFDPCEDYIDGNIEGHADTIKWILGRIESWKSYSQYVSDSHYARSEIVQWIIVMLSFLTTIAAAITKLYPKLSIRGMDFAVAPIVLSAMIAAVTSINAFYQFDESRRLSQNLADDLEELETDIHFRVLRHVASRRQEQVDDATVNDWHERLKSIMQRYSQRETGNGV